MDLVSRANNYVAWFKNANIRDFQGNIDGLVEVANSLTTVVGNITAENRVLLADRDKLTTDVADLTRIRMDADRFVDALSADNSALVQKNKELGAELINLSARIAINASIFEEAVKLRDFESNRANYFSRLHKDSLDNLVAGLRVVRDSLYSGAYSEAWAKVCTLLPGEDSKTV